MTWFFYGLIVGAGGMHLIDRVRNAQVTVGWHVWILGAGALLLSTLALQHFFASYKELERRAAWVGLASLGVPAIIHAAVASWLFMTA
jgi:hypothetical protein